MKSPVFLVIVFATRIASAESEPVPDDKSGGVAIALSGLSTAGAIVALATADKVHHEGMQKGMVVGGLLGLAVGPTLGHLYAGHPWNTGLQIRLASLASGTVGLALFAASDPFGSSPNEGMATVGAVLVVASAIAYGAGTFYEIVTSTDAPRRRKNRSVTLAPSVGAGTTSVNVLGRF